MKAVILWSFGQLKTRSDHSQCTLRHIVGTLTDCAGSDKGPISETGSGGDRSRQRRTRCHFSKEVARAGSRQPSTLVSPRLRPGSWTRGDGRNLQSTSRTFISSMLALSCHTYRTAHVSFPPLIDQGHSDTLTSFCLHPPFSPTFHPTPSIHLRNPLVFWGNWAVCRPQSPSSFEHELASTSSPRHAVLVPGTVVHIMTVP